MTLLQLTAAPSALGGPGRKVELRQRTGAARPTMRFSGPAAHGGQIIKTVVEAIAVIAIGIVLMATGIWFSLPHKKLSDVPKGVTLLSSPKDRQGVFSSLAGNYLTGKRPGDMVVMVSSEGRVSLGVIGKDGKPIQPPRREEQARAGRRLRTDCVVTSFGVIAAAPPDVTMGNLKLRRER